MAVDAAGAGVAILAEVAGAALDAAFARLFNSNGGAAALGGVGLNGGDRGAGGGLLAGDTAVAAVDLGLENSPNGCAVRGTLPIGLAVCFVFS